MLGLQRLTVGLVPKMADRCIDHEPGLTGRDQLASAIEQLKEWSVDFDTVGAFSGGSAMDRAGRLLLLGKRS